MSYVPVPPPPKKLSLTGNSDADIPHCDYCRSVLFLDYRGCCCACGAPGSEHVLLPVTASPQKIAVLKVSRMLSAAALERIHQQWLDNFGPDSKLVILDNDMDIEFL